MCIFLFGYDRESGGKKAFWNERCVENKYVLDFGVRSAYE